MSIYNNNGLFSFHQIEIANYYFCQVFVCVYLCNKGIQICRKRFNINIGLQRHSTRAYKDRLSWPTCGNNDERTLSGVFQFMNLKLFFLCLTICLWCENFEKKWKFNNKAYEFLQIQCTPSKNSLKVIIFQNVELFFLT